MWLPHRGPVNIVEQITALQNMPTGELAAEYTRLFGRPPRYRSVPWMRKRIAHQLQVVAFGGLPRAAQAALDALRAEIQLPATPAPTIAPTPTTPRGLRPGTTLQRAWRGQQVRVEVTAEGFEWDGRKFGSLSAVALAVTGSHWNGRLFFGLAERRRA